MKKAIFGLNILLTLLFFFYSYSLWSFLNRTPSEDFRLDKFESHAPPAFQISLLKNYPDLFNVLTSDKNIKKTGLGKDGAEDELSTSRVRLRLRGIFTKEGKRLALVDMDSGSGSQLIKVCENDVLKGYRILSVEPKNISLKNEESGEILKLIIFKQEKDKDGENDKDKDRDKNRERSKDRPRERNKDRDRDKDKDRKVQN